MLGQDTGSFKTYGKKFVLNHKKILFGIKKDNFWEMGDQGPLWSVPSEMSCGYIVLTRRQKQRPQGLISK